MQVRVLGQEDPLEREVATHSSILASEIPWPEEPSRQLFWRRRRVGHGLEAKQQQYISMRVYYLLLLSGPVMHSSL